eukprot:3622921-Amphidinium_carterae.1
MTCDQTINSGCTVTEHRAIPNVIWKNQAGVLKKAYQKSDGAAVDEHEILTNEELLRQVEEESNKARRLSGSDEVLTKALAVTRGSA